MERHRIERSARAIVAAATTLAVLAVPGRAVAHAIVEATQPRIDQVVERSPTAVTMEFNEPVEIAFGAIRGVRHPRPEGRCRRGPARGRTGRRDHRAAPAGSRPRDLHGHLAGGLRGRTSDRGGLRLSRPATRAESPGHRRGHPVRRSGCRSPGGSPGRAGTVAHVQLAPGARRRGGLPGPGVATGGGRRAGRTRWRTGSVDDGYASSCGRGPWPSSPRCSCTWSTGPSRPTFR